jgi:hypothetical protein
MHVKGGAMNVLFVLSDPIKKEKKFSDPIKKEKKREDTHGPLKSVNKHVD